MNEIKATGRLLLRGPDAHPALTLEIIVYPLPDAALDDKGTDAEYSLDSYRDVC